MQLARSLRKRVQDADRTPGSVRARVRRVHQGGPDRRLHRVFRGRRAQRARARLGRHHALPAQAAARPTCWRFSTSSFDELHDGLKELSLANMAHRQRETMAPGVFTFPLEFAAIKPAAARLHRHPVRGKPVPVQARVPRLLLHQRAAGGRARQRVLAAGGAAASTWPSRQRRPWRPQARASMATSCWTCSAR